MSLSTSQVKIGSSKRGSVDSLNFTFKGQFTEAASIEACQSWDLLMAKNPTKQILIWDCSEMNGFEMAAKNQWIKSLNLNAKKISKVVVVSDNIMIRGAAHLMLKLFSFDSKVFRSSNKLDEYFALAA